MYRVRCSMYSVCTLYVLCTKVMTKQLWIDNLANGSALGALHSS